ncbi:TetR/AcrR family transcriptional regulator [Janthinobacterium agaricidamnosum]|uniref:Bacterial regulatory s, tetR family protein n=1 Tax=Janthinobacterium agaricidamnosum NBRC 102515 = DSM 9628 TaxID=1349767 RepID=W0V266_9BURK|nr:TetR/AcrR family transcriptional regulator [Janthinobacterium agaricidamnosum]CDG81372.1 bacterial regulatory s, tetR family protein [Janthinobacterium agaricidamnosum NBRC 102515 = DSM 9628]
MKETKPRGRPQRGGNKLERQAIVDAALGLLQSDAADFSMRSLSRQLGVDPMALYHYFRDKDALLKAVASLLFSALDPARPPFSAEDEAPVRLSGLCRAYLGLLRKAPMLMRLMTRGRVDHADAPARFAALFSLAIEEWRFSPAREALLRDVLVDYLHGYALAFLPAGDDGWQDGVALIVAGGRVG